MAEKAKVRVGPAGWSYRDWIGIVYPRRKSPRFQQATFLAGYFDTIEINVTFHRPVPARTATEWVEGVAQNPEFRYTAKLWHQFTHRGLEGNTSTIYAILDNHPEAKALVNAFQIIHALTGKKLDIPEKMIERFPELEPIATSRRPGAGFLFFD
jgi:hypothetical protein